VRRTFGEKMKNKYLNLSKVEFYPKKKIKFAHTTGGWLGSRSYLDAVAKKKNPAMPEIKSWLSSS
jgi:hypothetical protein